MAIKIVRVVFILACVTIGVLWANYLVNGIINPARLELEPPQAMLDGPMWPSIGGGIGFAIAIFLLVGLSLVTQDLFEKLAPALVAIVLAMVMGYFIAVYIRSWMPEMDKYVALLITVTLVMLFGFAGISLGLTRASNWQALAQAVARGSDTLDGAKIVDTSVIIDGRIAEICQTGFLEGTLLIPRFVLRELQAIADSSDMLRRARGRRGLDILKEMQGASSTIAVRVIEDDPPDIREVDAKLVRVARDSGAKILTNDFNLNKVAQIEGVIVLNINDLANAVKPAVLPDELMDVKIVREGKEAFQGVGYLDDGTMIVVEGGKTFVGRNVSVVVTSVLQTAAGRMIFSKLSSVA